MEEALGPLVLIAIGLFAMAFAWTARKVIAAFIYPIVGFFSGIPVIGGTVANLIQSIENRLIGALGALYQGGDKIVGAAWHLLAKYLDWTWREIRSHAHLIEDLASLGAAGVLAQAVLRHLLHHQHARVQGIGDDVKTLKKEYYGIERQIRQIKREIHRGIGHDIRVRLNNLEGEITGIEQQTIPAIQAKVGANAGAIANVESWLGIKSGVNYRTWVKAFALAALGAIGLGGLNCLNFRNLLGKYGCGLGSLLDALLGLVISALALENVCRLLPVLETAFGDVVGPIVHLLTEVPLGACEQPPSGWAQLNVAMGPLPPPQTLGTLPG